ncbi:MAG: helix-hairpin-helix domain-containing protein [Calditerrivibrio sp.]|nr:helix-hairpin-helix domain-containing protein [Calditerrivibrio sp.]MCA1980493.1 helix-hairpin-helix domain-containing protein [Calditerrivibrio sp.]
MIDILAKEFQIKEFYIKNLINLTEEGATVPFIARYRKEMTGGMTETEIREILERKEYMENLEKRKSSIIESIKEKGKLTDELEKKIISTTNLKDLEDIYAPYRSKKKTKADIARENGLQPMADFIKNTDDSNEIERYAQNFINENIKSLDEAIEGAMEIIIFEIGHDIEIKNRVRELIRENGKINTEKRKDVTSRTNFEDYYDFSQEITKIPPHRVLAIFRGESEKILKVKLYIDEDILINAIKGKISSKNIILNRYVESAIKYALKRIILLSLELEFRQELFFSAEEKAIKIFSENLRALLMTPPVKNARILGIDPAFRTGCKYAAIDETGRLLEYGVIYPTEPQKDYENSKRILIDLIKKHKINGIAIGNGTASRETEEFISKIISEEKLQIGYTIVSEAGASVYSASENAIKEFPELDVTIRGAISIARRVLDPLSELIKIDPKSIGVGMYQHDVNQKKLSHKLDEVVVDVVNNVGVDINTASFNLLKYVSGLNENIAEKIIEYRNKKGLFNSREELKKISGIGEVTFNQAAGFLKIYDGDEPLDRMFIHPEQYDNVYKLLNYLELSIENANMIRFKLKGEKIDDICKKFNIG